MSESKAPDPDRDRRVEEIFDAAAPLPQAERARYVREACAGDESLERDVEELLGYAGEKAQSFLSIPAVEKIGGASDAAGDSLGAQLRQVAHGGGAAAMSDLSGQRLGSYTILERIGAGGMGVVYRAEQDNPRRIVAIKVIGAGVLARSTAARFDQEAHVLARLHHAGIASIIGAGTARLGATEIPFYAMEYVAGAPLLEFVTHRQLSRRERLGLFLRVCAAVQHAHAKGVIHRDLKPGNILVCEDGQPKILDFGVARAVERGAVGADAAGVHTQHGQVLGTVPYLSPEQASGNPRAIDTRTDVYSLGVILYELLSGTLPHDVRGKPLHEALALLRDVDAVPLGERARELRGDLEVITTKALAKEKERRYGAVAELAADVERHLRGEPIRARAASPFYLVARYARRHKIVAGGVALAAMALAILIPVAMHMADVAREETARAKAAREFIVDMLHAPANTLGDGRELRLVEVLDTGVAKLASRYNDNASFAIKSSLLETLGTSYLGLGLFDQARALMTDVYERKRGLLGEEHPETQRVAGLLARCRDGAAGGR